MEKKLLLEQLSALSLGTNEAAVYLELLSIGTCHAGPLIKQTGLHRQLVYLALDRLEEMGLVSISVANNKKVFQASPPQELVRLQEERKTKARLIVPHLQALLPENHDRLAVHTLSGRKELIKNILVTLEIADRNDKVVRVIGGASSESFYEAIEDGYESYVALGQKLKIKKRLIAPSETAEIFRARFAREKGTTLKLVDEGLSSPTYTRITPEMVSLEIYGTTPTVIQIWNREIAKGYIEHFELLWKRAQRYVVK